ncbi:MAG: gamma-glutamylcyclotransferase family protein [Dehalococcoidia bacterium]|nr:gamma-glutamylcyclotransferase family protein [Dehalococcoidia bacterium]
MYYFAYGANLNRKQMSERCPACKPLFRATLPNHKLIFTGWSRKWRGGTATIRPAQGEKVLGGIYEVSEADLKTLDGFEDVPQTNSRAKKTVVKDGGDWVEVVAYVKREQLEEAKPSPEYLAIVRQGYKDWRII